MCYKSWKCCVHCIDDISEEDEVAAELWVKLCGLSVPDGFLNFRKKTRFLNYLELLELMGYVVTHETDKYFQVKIEGIYEGEDDSEYCFCVDPFSHRG